MYGLIGRRKTVPAQRDAVIAAPLDGVGSMPGCRSDGVVRDPAHANASWITAAGDDKFGHAAAIVRPALRDAIALAPACLVIAGFGDHFETEPVGGHGFGIAHAGGAGA